MNARTISLGLGLAVAAGTLALVGTGGAASAGGGGCHQPAVTEGAGSEVRIGENGCFSPTVLRVDPGTEVVFENQQDGLHNVSGLSWGTWEGPNSELSLGETFAQTFSTPGYYPYSCTLHYNMVGLVIVGEEPEAASQPAATVPDTEDAQPASVASQSAGGSGGGPSTWAVLTGAGVLVLGLVGGGALLRSRGRP